MMEMTISVPLSLPWCANICHYTQNVILHLIYLPCQRGRSSFKDLYLVFSAIMLLTVKIWKSVQRFCQLISISIQILHSGTAEIIIGWIHGHNSSTMI